MKCVRKSRKCGNGLDIVSAINSITPKGIEFHLTDEGDDGVIRKASFTGPNTNLDARLSNYNKDTGTFTSVITPPINALDRAALIHDTDYHDKDINARHIADNKLMVAASNIVNDPNSTVMQRRNANIVKLIMQAKTTLGLGIGIGIEATPNNSAVRSSLHQGIGIEATPNNSAVRSSLHQGSRVNFDPGTVRGKTDLTGLIVGLLGTAAVIGIPALLKLIKKADKTKN